MDGPYRATKLWNEMLHIFKHGMPLRRHRRHMKVYDNCFSGAEAIHWLQLALKDNPNVKPGISKTQVRQLLSKFMKAGIFCSVCTSNATQDLKENEIYQFTNHNNGSSIELTPEHMKTSDKVLVRDTKDSIKANSNRKKGNIRVSSEAASTYPQYLQNPLENYSQEDVIAEKNAHEGRNENFSTSEKHGRILRECENNNVQNENIYSSQAQNSSHPVLMPPRKPHRQMGSSIGYSNSGSVSDRYDATQNFNLQQKYQQHEARIFPRNSINTCTLSERHGRVNSYSSSTQCCPSYEFACHKTYDRVDASRLRQDGCSEFCRYPSKTAHNDVDYGRNTNTVINDENCQYYSLSAQPGKVNRLSKSEHRNSHSMIPLQPLHNSIPVHEPRGSYCLNSYEKYRRDYTGKIISDNTSQFSPSECNGYDSTKYKLQEKRVINDGYKKVRNVQFGSAATTETVNTSSSETEIRNTWRMVFISRLETVLAGMEEITSLLPPNIRIDWLIRNVQEQTDTLLKSSSIDSDLNDWPEDVINHYRKQFAGMKEPLITIDFYSLITETYLYVEHVNNASAQFVCKSRETMPTSRSVENLVLGMASPCVTNVKKSQYIPNENTAIRSGVYCYETAFASDTPITRIVPQSTLNTVYFQRQAPLTQSFRSSRDRFPPEELISVYDKNTNLVGISRDSQQSRIVWRSKSSQDMKESVNSNGLDKPTKEKVQNRSSRRPWRMTRKLSDTNQKSSGLQHCRNKSGGYVNPALSQSLEDLSSQKLYSEEFDYAAALESLQTLMHHTHMTMQEKNDKVQESNCDLSSESGSYYTAASTPDRQKYANVCLSREHEQSKWKQPAVGLGIAVFQLLLLLISPGSRCLLKRLLRCLHHLPTAMNTEEAFQVIQSMTPNVLANEQENDKMLPFKVVRFLVTFYKDVFEVPVDLQICISKQLPQGIKTQKVTYCEQVTSKQFEEQGLSGSQKALSELLEQILRDSRMGVKEKKRKLKMFRERYPNIYKQHFPDTDEDRTSSEKTRGILQLPSLGKLKNIRI